MTTRILDEDREARCRDRLLQAARRLEELSRKLRERGDEVSEILVATAAFELLREANQIPGPDADEHADELERQRKRVNA